MKKTREFTPIEALKDKLMIFLVYSENPLIYRLYAIYRKLVESLAPLSNPHVDHKRKIIFLHNPKVGGTSLRQILKLPKKGVYHHYTPTFLVSKGLWEKYFSIVAVRNPLDRFISAYFEIVNKEYTGYFRRKYPNVYKLTPRQFFEMFKKELFMTMPQHRYARHFLSTKPIDFVIRLESLNKDLEKLTKVSGLKIRYSKPAHLNKRRYDKNLILKDKKLVSDIKNYYRPDYLIFGYKFD